MCDLDEDELADLYYVALLRFVGCNADAHIAAATFGDELIARGHFAEAGFRTTVQRVRHVAAPSRRVGTTTYPARMLATAVANMPRLYGTALAHCEIGQPLADRFDLGPNVRQARLEAFERWDGRGTPRRLKGEAVAFAARVVPLATDAVVYFRLGGVDAARGVVRQRSGGAYDPRLVERFARMRTGCSLISEWRRPGTWHWTVSPAENHDYHLDSSRRPCAPWLTLST